MIGDGKKDVPTNVCHSGGSKGADLLFGKLAARAGHKVFHHSFAGHYTDDCPEGTVVTHNAFELSLADKELRKCVGFLKKEYPTRSIYVNGLLQRNYYQINNSDRVYASCAFDSGFIPQGGTAWALTMAMNRGITEIYNFDWSAFNGLGAWYKWRGTFMDKWEEIPAKDVPLPYGSYAGIGSSGLPGNGRQAIWDLYRDHNFITR